MTEVLRLSNSEASMWRQCRRSWYLSVYLSLRPKRAHDAAPNRPLGIGTRVHDALAAYYVVEGQTPGDPLLFLADTYRQLRMNDPVGEDEWLKEEKLTTAMLAGYMDWLEETGVDQDLRVLAPETKVEVPLLKSTENGTVLATLLSKIDARVEKESDGHRLALEHKTCANLKFTAPILQSDTQLLTEHLVEFLDLRARGVEDTRADGVLYNKLKKNLRTVAAKPPFYEREEITHNIHELRAHSLHMKAQAAEIINARQRLDAGESHHVICPPSPSRDLTWRSAFFRAGIYEMMDDGSDWQQALADGFEKYDPLERYAGVGAYDEVG